MTGLVTTCQTVGHERGNDLNTNLKGVNDDGKVCDH